MILDLLGDIGTVTPKFSEKIPDEQNEKTIKRWHRLAAKSENIDQFLNEM